MLYNTGKGGANLTIICTDSWLIYNNSYLCIILLYFYKNQLLQHLPKAIKINVVA